MASEFAGSDENQLVSNVVLFKKRHRTAQWERVTVSFVDTSLTYCRCPVGKEPESQQGTGDSSQAKNLPAGNRKSIVLTAAKVADEDNFPDHPCAFSILPKGSKRVYYFAAEDNEAKMKVLNAVCTLQMTEKSSGADKSSACLVQ